MKSVCSRLFILGLLIALGQGMASRAEAGSPAWSKKITGAKRFELVLDDTAVLDNETNLVWEKSPDTSTQNWYGAQAFCNDRVVDGRKGWRLPTVQELASLVDPTQFNPTLPPGHPFTNVQSALYWSATARPFIIDPSTAWGVILFNGNTGAFSKTDTNFMWCVRGGQGSPDTQ